MLSFLNLDTYLLTYYFCRANTVNSIKIPYKLLDIVGFLKKIQFSVLFV